MAKPSVVVPEVGGAAVASAQAACPCPGTMFPYPPPRAGIAAAVRRKCLQVDLGSATAGLLGAAAGAWGVESMRASSPTHAKAAAALAAGVDDERAAWMARHPSALGKFEEIVAASEGKRIVMFLDYDGTLSPIVNDPDAAFMSETMRMAVRSVAKHFPTAIVSGRCRDKVFEFVKLAELYYAGSHGMDIRGPAKTSSRHAKANKAKGVLFQPASEFLPMIEQVHDRLVEQTRSIPGAKVENNKFCVSVHFRCVDEKMWGDLSEAVKGVLREYPRLRLTQGRMVFEVRPTIKWDKGKALEFLLESLGFADCNNVLPVYIGDDRTDEDAFKVLRRRGQGVGILVSKHPKETSASYSLQEPAEVSDMHADLSPAESRPPHPVVPSNTPPTGPCQSGTMTPLETQTRFVRPCFSDANAFAAAMPAWAGWTTHYRCARWWRALPTSHITSVSREATMLMLSIVVARADICAVRGCR